MAVAVKGVDRLVRGRDHVGAAHLDHLAPHAGPGAVGAVAVDDEAQPRAVGRFEDHRARLEGQVNVIVVGPAVAQGGGVELGRPRVVGALEAQGLAQGGDGDVLLLIVVVARGGVDGTAHPVLGLAAVAEWTLVGGPGLVRGENITANAVSKSYAVYVAIHGLNKRPLESQAQHNIFVVNLYTGRQSIVAAARWFV